MHLSFLNLKCYFFACFSLAWHPSCEECGTHKSITEHWQNYLGEHVVMFWAPYHVEDSLMVRAVENRKWIPKFCLMFRSIYIFILPHRIDLFRLNLVIGYFEYKVFTKLCMACIIHSDHITKVPEWWTHVYCLYINNFYIAYSYMKRNTYNGKKIHVLWNKSGNDFVIE